MTIETYGHASHELKGVSKQRKIFAIPQAEEMNQKQASAN